MFKFWQCITKISSSRENQISSKLAEKYAKADIKREKRERKRLARLSK